MKIAFLVGEFPSLSETFVLNQITGLLDRGHTVDIFATRPSPQKLQKIHPDVEQYQLLQRTFYEPSIPHSWLTRSLKAIRLLLTVLLRRPSLLSKLLDIHTYGRQAASLRLLYEAIPFLKHPHPSYDVILCHFGSNGVKGNQLRELGLLQGKLCTIFHGFDLTGYVQREGDRIYEKLFRHGDLFLPISDRWKHTLIHLGCPPNKLQVHRMGIDCNEFAFTPRTMPADGVIRIATVCRLVEKKGVEYGIRAIAKLKERYPKLVYTIIGDGPLRADLEHLILKLEVNQQVHLLGWMEQQDVIQLLNKCEFFLAPSVTAQNGDQEGIPVVLMEAMAMGIPVISTYHSGIPELVEQDVSGILVNEQDVEQLADRLSQLIESPERWLAMGYAARSRVKALYNIHQLNQVLEQRLQQLIEPLSTESQPAQTAAITGFN